MKAHILDFRLIVNNELFMHSGDEQVIINQSNGNFAALFLPWRRYMWVRPRIYVFTGWSDILFLVKR